MNIRVKTSAPQTRDLGLNHGAGKGDVPRNLSKAFRENYEEIQWGSEKTPGKWRKVYPR